MTKSEFRCKDMTNEKGTNKCSECPFYEVFDGCCWAKNENETLEEVYQRFSKMLQYFLIFTRQWNIIIFVWLFRTF